MDKLPALPGIKRPRDDEIEFTDAADAKRMPLDKNLSFCDTFIALQIMRAQFPKIEKATLEPFVLRTQLYSSVKNRTQVDRELEALKKEKTVRIFKLNTGQDDHAVMLMDDYLKQMKKAVKRTQVKKLDDIAIFDWFEAHVIGSKLETGIEHHELCLLLSCGGTVEDEHVSLLINAGLLIRQLIDSNMYWFAIPNTGSVLKSLSQGRKELLSFLNKRRNKEMLMASLERKQLRHSVLDIRFHLRDLIGSGALEIIGTPAGLLVRVSKD